MTILSPVLFLIAGTVSQYNLMWLQPDAGLVCDERVFSYYLQKYSIRPLVPDSSVTADIVAGDIDRCLSDSLGPFDEERYCFNRIEVIVGFERELRYNLSGTFGGNDLVRYHLVLHLIGEQTESWWRIWEEDRPYFERDESSSLISWGFAGMTPATENPALPIVRLSFVDVFSPSAREDVTTKSIVIDLRWHTPQVIAGISCFENPVEMVPPETGSSCVLNDRAGQLHCTDTRVIELPWVSRTVRRQMVLGEPYPQESWEEVEAGLQKAGRFLLAVTGDSPASLLPFRAQGAGTVLLLQRLVKRDTMPPEAGCLLLAIPPRCAERFGSRFYLVWSSQDDIKVSGLGYRRLRRQTSSKRIEQRFGGWDRCPSWQSLDSTVQLSTTRIHQEEALAVYRVVESEGSARALYWIAIEYPIESASGTPEARGSVLRVAQSIVTSSGEVFQSSGAAGFELSGDPFTAYFDLEPGRRGDPAIDYSDNQPACPALATVTWDQKEGFKIKLEEPPCSGPSSTRRIEIADDGRLLVRRWQ